jgi:hypothetical protein
MEMEMAPASQPAPERRQPGHSNVDLKVPPQAEIPPIRIAMTRHEVRLATESGAFIVEDFRQIRRRPPARSGGANSEIKSDQRSRTTSATLTALEFASARTAPRSSAFESIPNPVGEATL